MGRYVSAVIGFCAITLLYGAVTLFVLFVLVMSHCALSDAQIAAGETCTPLGDLYFKPAVATAVVGFVVVQTLFLRSVLGRSRKR